ncbi:MAG: hypothetical protein ACP5M9_03385 [Candidatus Micrarchaeia archaeon]
MEIEKKSGERNSNSTLNIIKKPKTLVTATVIAASLMGALRPSEKPAEARINPIVGGLIIGTLNGLEAGVNYDIARNIGGIYEGYGYGYTPYCGGIEGSYPVYSNCAPAYVSPYNGYNYAPAYVSPYNGYNDAPAYVTPYNGYNNAPTYISPYSTEGSYPVYQNSAPAYVTPYNNTVGPTSYAAPQSTETYVAPTNYTNTNMQQGYTATLFPKPKVVMTWPEKRALELQYAMRNNAIQKQQAQQIVNPTQIENNNNNIQVVSLKVQTPNVKSSNGKYMEVNESISKQESPANSTTVKKYVYRYEDKNGEEVTKTQTVTKKVRTYVIEPASYEKPSDSNAASAVSGNIAYGNLMNNNVVAQEVDNLSYMPKNLNGVVVDAAVFLGIGGGIFAGLTLLKRKSA